MYALNLHVRHGIAHRERPKQLAGVFQSMLPVVDLYDVSTCLPLLSLEGWVVRGRTSAATKSLIHAVSICAAVVSPGKQNQGNVVISRRCSRNRGGESMHELTPTRLASTSAAV